MYLVALHCRLSIFLMSCSKWGLHTGEQYDKGHLTSERYSDLSRSALHLPSNINASVPFHQRKSTALNLLTSISCIVDSMGAKHNLDTVFLEVWKAFDSVGHMVLLSKLQYIGFAGEALPWFKGYLDNRQHCVRLEGHIPNKLPVKSAVPQGSILDPILFQLYVNLPLCLTFLFLNVCGRHWVWKRNHFSARFWTPSRRPLPIDVGWRLIATITKLMTSFVCWKLLSGQVNHSVNSHKQKDGLWLCITILYYVLILHYINILILY